MTILEVNFISILTPILFGLFFILSFFILDATRLPELFKKGKVWQIRASYLILAIIIAYLLTRASLLIINLGL